MNKSFASIARFSYISGIAATLALPSTRLQAAAADDAANGDSVYKPFPVLENLNQIDNEDQIDTPEELKTASKTPDELSSDELSKELSNPNSPLASMVFKQVYTSWDGDLPNAGDQSSKITQFQPVFPFPLSDDGTTNLFTRPVFAYAWQQPVFDPAKNDFEDESGLLDPGFDIALGKTLDSGFVAVAGIQGTTPWGADSLSADQWRLGPEILLAKLNEKNFLAMFPAHQWDVSGGDQGYSTTQLELFGGIYLPNAWTIYTDSKWFYNWKENQATIPINLTIRKVTKLGALPFKLELALDYFIESDNRFGQDWAVSLNISPVVPNFIYDLFQ